MLLVDRLKLDASRSSPSQFQLTPDRYRYVCEPTGSPAFFSPFQIPKDSTEDQQISGSASAGCQKYTTLRLERAMTAGSQAGASMMLGRRQYGSCSPRQPDGRPSLGAGRHCAFQP